MHLGIGEIVWIIVVLFGVVSSMRKSAAKNRQRSAPRTIPPPPAAVAPPQRPIAQIAFADVPPTITLVPAPPQVASPPPAPVVAAVRPVGTGLVRGMFEGPATLVRAIVAAEILGPPLSMQEQSIWSPRHKEPSI
jgi:hypothetical protein